MMKQSREFDNILNECLERLFLGDTPKQCLARFPEYAGELKTLLETAYSVNMAATIQPRPEFRADARIRLQSALDKTEQKTRRSFFVWLRQPQWAVTVSLLIVLAVGGSTVTLANSSMPDQPLYAVKLVMERLQLSLPASPVAKATLYARLTERRVTEITRMADENKPERIEQVSRHLDTLVTEIAASSTVPEKLTAPAAEAQLAAPAPAPVMPAAPAAPDFAAAAPAAAPVLPSAENVNEPALLSPPPVGAEPPQSIIDAPPTPRARDNTVQSQLPETAQSQLMVKLAYEASANLARLRALLDTVPESTQPALLDAISAAEKTYTTIMQFLDSN